MDIALFTFFISLAFLCMFLAWIFKRSGIGMGIGVIGMMLFLMLGLMIGGNNEVITSVQVLSDSAGVDTVTHEPLDLGLTNSILSIMFFALAILAFYSGV
jgi:hypothetical protein